MATDVHRRGHGRFLEGLSVVAGAAHLIPPDAGPRNNGQAASLRASYQQYVGVSSTPGDLPHGQASFHQKADSFGPKLVQGDYTYTTSRKSLMVSSKLVGNGSLPLPPGPLSATTSAASTAPRGTTIPAVATTNAVNVNTAAWRAYGSPSARTHQRPPLVPGTAGSGGTAPGPSSPSGNRLPRVGGFKPRRPQSAPSGGGEGGGDLGPVIAAIASTASVGTGTRRGFRAPDVMDVGVLAVEQPDPIWAGRTDSGRVMFEYTLPTDPYARYIWEEQARKARATMARHIAAMAAAAAVNGGSAFSHASSSSAGGGSGASRPGSAKRGAGAAAAGAGVLGASGLGMRPRFSSTSLAEAARQGVDYKPPTVVGFAPPDMTEDTTMPGPNDPRWAYTRLGRTQVTRLQQSLKMCLAPKHQMRPSSAPALASVAGVAIATTATVSAAPGIGVCVGTDSSVSAVGVCASAVSPEGSLARGELSVLDPFSDPTQGGAAAVTALSAAAAAGRASELEGQRSATVTMLRTASGSGGTRPGSAGLARPGSASVARASSGNLARAGSGNVPLQQRPGSASATGAMVSGLSLSTGPAVPTVRGASAGRTREAAPNPRVDLRMYLAEAEADADDDDDGTEMLPVGDLAAAGLFDAGGGTVLIGADGLPLPPEVLQSMPVPADQLAARLAEMVAAVAVVAAQKQIDGSHDGNGDSEGQPRVWIEEMGQSAALDLDAAAAAAAAVAPEEGFPPPPPPLQAPRFSRPVGDDALMALHGASTFGNRGSDRVSSHSSVKYGSHGQILSGQYDANGISDWGDGHEAPPMEQPLGLGLGLAPRPSSRAGRPTSARPTSARPTAGLAGRRSISPVRVLGDGLDGGMDVIMEQSEGNVGEEY